MDGERFDNLARGLTSRRTTIGGLLAGLLLPLEAAARKKGQGKDKQRKRKGNGKDRGKDTNKKRASAQADACWRAGACLLKKGANVSQCNLAGYTAPPSLDCTGCNLSRANLRDATFMGTTFTRANLSGACLIGANFTGATFTNSTNLYGAIFCNTTMPNGNVNNSGCGSGTACCSTCMPTTCQVLGKQCGTWPDGCGGTLSCGSCPNRQICDSGTCQSCDVCASGCAFTSVQAAINATTPQLTTIRVCPGTYIENALFFVAVVIDRPLTLIGAGDGADPATSTILRPALTDQTLVSVFQAGTVRLEGVRLTGAMGPSTSGLGVDNTTLTVANSTITENTGSDFGGAIAISSNAQVTLINTRVVKNTGVFVGGVYLISGSLTLDTLSRVTGNVATDPTFGVGGIRSDGFPVTLPSVDNVTGNTPNNCRAFFGGSFTGPGAVCTTT